VPSCHLEDIIELRPIYHQTDRRVGTHLFVAALAFLLHRALEKKAQGRRAGSDREGGVAGLPQGRRGRVPPGGRAQQTLRYSGMAQATRILAALGITEIEPSPPSKQGAIVV